MDPLAAREMGTVFQLRKTTSTGVHGSLHQLRALWETEHLCMFSMYFKISISVQRLSEITEQRRTWCYGPDYHLVQLNKLGESTIISPGTK